MRELFVAQYEDVSPLRNYSLITALSVLQAGLNAFPSFAPYRHPKKNMVHILATGPRVDLHTSFESVHLKLWDGENARLRENEAEHILYLLLKEMGVHHIPNMQAYPGTINGRCTYTSNPNSFSTAHERIEAISTVAELMPRVSETMPFLEDRCPDLFKPSPV
jgi:hypothetical protein